jgi:glycerol-3-phosphate dehydrogenase
VIFINPYEDNLALIGTTDIPYDGRAEDVAVDETEIDYLFKVVNRYMRHQLKREDVVSAFSGVRPLYDDNAANPSAVTRDYVFDIDGTPPLLSVFGGKITTYRKLSEHAMRKLQPFLPNMKGDWTASATLPGGDMPKSDFEAFLKAFQKQVPWLPPDLAYHYARLYGTRAPRVIAGATSNAGLGKHFGSLLYEAEVKYLRKYEWAQTAEDVLDRRTKFGLHVTPASRETLTRYMAA